MPSLIRLEKLEVQHHFNLLTTSLWPPHMDRPLMDVVSSCGITPLDYLTLKEGQTLTLGRFDRVGVAALATGAAVNAVEIADGESCC